MCYMYNNFLTTNAHELKRIRISIINLQYSIIIIITEFFPFPKTYYLPNFIVPSYSSVFFLTYAFFACVFLYDVISLFSVFFRCNCFTLQKERFTHLRQPSLGLSFIYFVRIYNLNKYNFVILDKSPCH